jgi:hypothetical protein
MARARFAGIVAVAGSGCAIVGSFLPWIVATDPMSGITLAKAGIDGHYAIVVDLMALISAAIGGFVLYRQHASGAFALAMVVLPLAQLGLVIFVGSNLSRGVVQLQAVGALASLGFGIYLTALGTVTELIGGTLAWTKGSLRTSIWRLRFKRAARHFRHFSSKL